jgi:hypothetical protein
MAWVYELPFLKENKALLGQVLGGWQLNGVFSAFSGTPYSIGGTNNALNCPSCGSVRINISEDPKPIGSAGSSTEPYYAVEIFSQPTGTGKEGFGNSGRNRFRRPPVWNADLSLFKAFSIGRFRPEVRIEARNVLNHPNWGAPVTGITALNFMRFTPASADSAANGPSHGSPRNVQLGLRFQF